MPLKLILSPAMDLWMVSRIICRGSVSTNDGVLEEYLKPYVASSLKGALKSIVFM
jgi:hypothetical protein